MRKALTGFSALALACVLPGISAETIDYAHAEKAVQASIALFPGDDIQSDYQAHRIHVADLDGDGVDEILYHRTARCTGANFDCTNELVIMTALEPDDRRAGARNPMSLPRWDAELAAVRDSGYAEDASVQIPGEVEQVGVSANRVEVAFNVLEDSPICRRRTYAREGYEPTTHCPAPGRYVWTYAWRPGEFRPADETTP